jgi:hypothetical protein
MGKSTIERRVDGRAEALLRREDRGADSLSPAPESSPPGRARVPAARQSNCTSPRRQSAGARRSRHVGRDSSWRTWCAMPPRCHWRGRWRREARNMPPVISTIVMLGLFARRQRTSMSARSTNALTAPGGLGLRVSLRGGALPDRAARGSVAPRKMACRPTAEARLMRFKAINSRTGEGQPGRCPFLIGSGNGRQNNTRPCLTRLPVAALRNHRLGCGSRCFCLSLLCARWSRRSRDSLGLLALTWTKTISRSSAPQPRVRPASGGTTTTM